MSQENNEQKKMTNREAFNSYIAAEITKSHLEVCRLPNSVFTAWLFKTKDAMLVKYLYKELQWFWFTYGGRDYGRGLDNVIAWLDAPFEGDINKELEKWERSNGDWADAITKSFGEMKDPVDGR